MLLSFHWRNKLWPWTVSEIGDCFCLLCIRSNDNFVLELDFEPFNASFPRPSRSSSIGNGVQFLNRHLSSIMFRNKDSLDPLLDFLRAHKYKGHVSVFCYVMNLFQKWNLCTSLSDIYSLSEYFSKVLNVLFIYFLF